MNKSRFYIINTKLSKEMMLCRSGQVWTEWVLTPYHSAELPVIYNIAVLLNSQSWCLVYK